MLKQTFLIRSDGLVFFEKRRLAIVIVIREMSGKKNTSNKASSCTNRDDYDKKKAECERIKKERV